MELLEEFGWRRLVAQISDQQGLEAHLRSGSRTVYCGFDPTADSLHIGNLVPLLALRRFQLFGHRPIVLMGGATGLIGDPSFKDTERTLNVPDVVAEWAEKIRRQVAPFVDFEGNNGAILANNLEWTENRSVISFLRDIGKHFSVNAMIQRDSVKARLQREDQGISYTEFSYMLLQGMDYLELAERHGCSVQIGGSDQWGNIVSGVDLVRRQLRRDVYAMTLGLVTKADGTKFGKTADGAIWLDAERTSPYQFYQFWLNTADADVETYLRYFTFLDRDQITGLGEALRDAPERREAQTTLAQEVTRTVHGDAAVVSAERITKALFAGELQGLTESDLEQLALDGMDRSVIAPGAGVLSALAESGLARSTSEARKLIRGRGIRLNGEVLTDEAAQLDFSDALFGRYFLVRKGKKNWHLWQSEKN